MAGDLGDIGESVGTVATGAMAARAVEPSASGPAADGHTAESSCLNCGATLAGPHCHQCGQRAHVHRTLSAFFHDLLHGVLHFEGKTWRTLPLLVWKPGKLTRDYIDGKRARYVSPIALFLFVVFLSFALFNLIGGVGESASEAPPDLAIEDGAGPRAIADEIARLERELEAARAAGEATGTIETELEGSRKALRLIDGATGTSGGESRTDAEQTVVEAARTVADKVRKNPQLMIYKMQTNAYKFSWLLIPLSVPFVWLLFAFDRRFRGYDHTVFTTYSITFMIALVAAASLLGYFGYGGLAFLMLFYAPFHMYRHLRGTYAVGRFGAFWRMLALSLFAWLAIALFVILLGWMAV